MTVDVGDGHRPLHRPHINTEIARLPSLAYIANRALEVKMATRNVVLTDAQSALVDQLVDSGRFQNASEALRAGLRLLQEDEAERSALRDRLVLGVEEARQENFAEGNGEEAMKRAFAEARSKS
jgi:antitoxin ParD1/3/4